MNDSMHTARVASRPAPQGDGHADNAAALGATWV